VLLLWALFDIATEVGKLRAVLVEHLDNITKGIGYIRSELEDLRRKQEGNSIK